MKLATFLTVLVLAGLTFMVGTISQAAGPPDAVTLTATDVTTNSATLRAVVNPNGSSTFAWFVWSDWRWPNQVSPAEDIGDGTAEVPLIFALTNLSPTKGYTFVCSATNALGVSVGTNCSILTLGWPFLGTRDATSLTTSGATLNGVIVPNGFPATAWFDYGLTTNYGSRTPDMMLGSATTLLAVSNTVSEYPQLTTVHFRLVGSNIWGVSTGTDASFTTLGLAGTALRFDGLTNAVRLPVIDVTGSSNVTLEAWVASGGVSGPVIVMHSSDWRLPVWSLSFNVYQALQFTVWTTTSTANLTSTFPMNGYNGSLWHHIAATYDGRSMAVYHNGRLLATQPKTGILSWHATDHLIGTNFGGERFNGLIDEVRIWNRARTQAEIDQGRFQRLTGDEAGLLGYWRFDEGSGATAIDSGIYGRTGTILGLPRREFSGVPLGFPYVQTTAATLAGPDTATLTGAVNPSGFATTGWFEWGATTNYGNISCDQNLGNGRQLLPMSQAVPGLLPDTTYYFHATARNTNAVVRGPDQTFVLGPRDKALRFDGINDYVDGPAADLGGTNQLTIEAWVKPERLSSSSVYDIVRQETPATTVPTAPPPADWLLRFNGPSVELWLNTGTSPYSFQSLSAPIDPAAFNDGLWHHLAATYDGTNKHLYHNGLEIAASTQSGNLMNSGSRLAIGARPEQAGEFFCGSIDEVRIWKTARRQAEIIRDMNRPLSGSETDLVAYFPFREGTGQITADLGPRGIPDTLMNSPTWIMSDALGRPFCVALPVTNLSNISATLNAAVNPQGLDGSAWFEWGLTTNYGNATIPQPVGAGMTVLYVTQLISNLTPGTDYHYRCVCSNATATFVSLDVPFRALGPKVETLAPMALTATSMMLSGFVDTYGIPTKYWFEWGITDSYGSTTPQRDAGTGYWRVNSEVVSNLTIGQTYHFRVMATNSGGLATGGDAVFTPFLGNTLSGCCFVYGGSVSWGDYNQDDTLD
ncbi:MAG TPA: LamG-like jellyroll fold domain-containing protein, partial [Verrucomicrobiae bacterium]